MESWRKAWREGVAPLLSNRSLTALREALRTDDVRLAQGATVVPPPVIDPFGDVLSAEPTAACALGFCGWVGEGLETVTEVEEFFARMCQAIDDRLGEPAACRWFLNAFDEMPRDEMRRELLAEVELALSARPSTQPETEVRCA